MHPHLSIGPFTVLFHNTVGLLEEPVQLLILPNSRHLFPSQTKKPALLQLYFPGPDPLGHPRRLRKSTGSVKCGNRALTKAVFNTSKCTNRLPKEHTWLSSETIIQMWLLLEMGIATITFNRRWLYHAELQNKTLGTRRPISIYKYLSKHTREVSGNKDSQ